jgi:hypothetical protein
VNPGVAQSATRPPAAGTTTAGRQRVRFGHRGPPLTDGASQPWDRPDAVPCGPARVASTRSASARQTPRRHRARASNSAATSSTPVASAAEAGSAAAAGSGGRSSPTRRRCGQSRRTHAAPITAPPTPTSCGRCSGISRRRSQHRSGRPRSPGCSR